MNYKEAKELGEECGLETPGEFISNVVIHSPSLFKYPEITKEIRELLIDARDNYGIEITQWEDELESEDCDEDRYVG